MATVTGPEFIKDSENITNQLSSIIEKLNNILSRCKNHSDRIYGSNPPSPSPPMPELPQAPNGFIQESEIQLEVINGKILDINNVLSRIENF